MNKKRTIVYIDGSNLYYGLLRDSTDKWLDLMLLYRNLEIGSTAGCRLPDSFATADGRMIHCPEAWRA